MGPDFQGGQPLGAKRGILSVLCYLLDDVPAWSSAWLGGGWWRWGRHPSRPYAMCFWLIPQPMVNPRLPRTLKVSQGWGGRANPALPLTMGVFFVLQPQFSRVSFLSAYHPCLISTSSLACLISTFLFSLKIKSLGGFNRCLEIRFCLTRKLSFSITLTSEAPWR